MTDLPVLFAAISWQHLLGSTPIEILATVSAIAGVILIARQNIWGWPLGILWAVLSAWLAITQWQLVSDGILYICYIPIQLYCWWIWVKNSRKVKTDEDSNFSPVWLPHKLQGFLAVAALICIVSWAYGISSLANQVSWIPQSALLWRDSTTTVLNFFAQFL